MEKKQKRQLTRKIELPQGVSATLEGRMIRLKGHGREIQRGIEASLDAEVSDSCITIRARKSNQIGKKKIGSYEAHIHNMLSGILQGHKYTLKICSGHFPMNVSVTGNKLMVKNLLGEKVPRALEFSKSAKVTIEGEIIHVESTDKEIAGQVAAAIEQLTRRPGFDTRVFQDGIYITNKDGKDIK